MCCAIQKSLENSLRRGGLEYRKLCGVIEKLVLKGYAKCWRDVITEKPGKR